jgi:hypothetical protein
VEGSREKSNEHWGFIEGGEFIDRLSDYQLFKTDSAP